MINETINATLYTPKIDCGTLKYSLSEKVNGTFKIIIFVLPALMIFKWWAIGKILNSGETFEKKKSLIEFAELFINGVSMVLFFYILYFTFLSGIDF
jgi:hypothetical protein